MPSELFLIHKGEVLLKTQYNFIKRFTVTLGLILVGLMPLSQVACHC